MTTAPPRPPRRVLDPRPLRGSAGEMLAAAWLAATGWEVVARDVRLGGVQVDLVARRGDVDAVVEVKARGVRAPGPQAGLQGLVSPGQLRRLERAARAWAARSPHVVRVDVLEVRLVLPFPRVLRHVDVLRGGPPSGA